MNQNFHLPGGSMIALATPFRDGRIDEAAFIQMCERQIVRDTTALVVCGSADEAAALKPAEQVLVVRMAVVTANGRVPVIAGCGGRSTEAAAVVASLAAANGAAVLLCAPTPYLKPSQGGIITHVRMPAHVSDLPLIVYDLPG